MNYLIYSGRQGLYGTHPQGGDGVRGGLQEFMELPLRGAWKFISIQGEVKSNPRWNAPSGEWNGAGESKAATVLMSDLVLPLSRSNYYLQELQQRCLWSPFTPGCVGPI